MKGLSKAKRNGLIDMKNFDLEVRLVYLCDVSGAAGRRVRSAGGAMRASKQVRAAACVFTRAWPHAHRGTCRAGRRCLPAGLAGLVAFHASGA